MEKDNLLQTLTTALEDAKLSLPRGRVADYIPELAWVDGNQLGICVVDLNGDIFAVGDSDVPFTIQSVGKVCALLMALENFGPDEVFNRIGMEPSGAPFSELTTLGEFPNQPSNPFINAGAIVLTSLLATRFSFEDFLAFVRNLCGNSQLQLNEAAFASEMAHSERNHSIAWELKRLKLLESGVDQSLEFYTRLCSIEVTARDLARFGLVLADFGQNLVSPTHITSTLSLMFTCGLYDGTGGFAVRAGFPAKSGVGGGIVAAVPSRYGIGTFGPALDDNGNSIGGMRMLENLGRTLGWHQFSR